MHSIYHWISEYGYPGLFLLLVLGIVGLPVPDESLLTYVGYLVYQGHLRALPTVLAAFLGSACGISVSYALGRTLGHLAIEKYGRYLHITPARMERVHRWFEHAGHWTLTFGYFVPGVRHLTAVVAGMSNLELPVFALYAYSGALVWALTFISAGFLLGEEWTRVEHILHKSLPIAMGVLALIGAAYLVRRYAGRWAGRSN